MNEILRFFYYILAGIIIAYIIYPFEVIQSFVTGKGEFSLRIPESDRNHGCFCANHGMCAVLLSVLMTRLVVS